MNSQLHMELMNILESDNTSARFFHEGIKRGLYLRNLYKMYKAHQFQEQYLNVEASFLNSNEYKRAHQIGMMFSKDVADDNANNR